MSKNGGFQEKGSVLRELKIYEHVCFEKDKEFNKENSDFMLFCNLLAGHDKICDFYKVLLGLEFTVR